MTEPRTAAGQRRDAKLAYFRDLSERAVGAQFLPPSWRELIEAIPWLLDQAEAASLDSDELRKAVEALPTFDDGAAMSRRKDVILPFVERAAVLSLLAEDVTRLGLTTESGRTATGKTGEAGGNPESSRPALLSAGNKAAPGWNAVEVSAGHVTSLEVSAGDKAKAPLCQRCGVSSINHDSHRFVAGDRAEAPR